MDNRAIGLYDSGLGGLSVWRAVKQRLPEESLLYLGDGANCPYGLRSKAEIRELAKSAVEELLSRGCKMIVVACNTATIAAIEMLRSQYPEVPFVGIEPAVKPACLNTKSGVVGVLATECSLRGDMFQNTAAKYSDNIRVIAKFGRGFVELVEENKEHTPEAQQIVREVVEEFVESGVDQIVLGCTHYPFLSDTIAKVAPNANIIDPSPAVAKQVERVLMQNNMKAEEEHSAQYEFITFADAAYQERLCKKAEGEF
ncbi:MAG: glutamate racemase [Rikenellaceae bacterium]